MDILGDYKPVVAMLGLQFCYAGISLFTRGALLQGMSPRVAVVYRLAIATFVIAPIAYFSRKKSSGCSSGLNLRSFSLIFLTAFIGVTANQNIFYEGLYLSSSTMGSAMGNLVPAITFVLAAVVGFEKINIGSLRSAAKISGTVVCVVGAICMALVKGSQLLNTEFFALQTKSIFGSGGDQTWLLGCLLLFGSSFCWSLWLVLQVPVSACYPDHLSLSAWIVFFATIQSATVAYLLEPTPESWILQTNLEFIACLFSGIVSGGSFFLQTWCISRRGPLFSAMFSPLCTVITTILAALFLHEKIYSGSLIGAVGVIIGLYIVLWGQAGETLSIKEDTNLKNQFDQIRIESILIDESSDKTISKTDLEEPLLSDHKSTDVIIESNNYQS
ncbi:hypothetical protein QYF36_006574 [Acer negundo]|nr:hypothetical protein QYF36_006574 [Acer negundo]